MTAPGRAAPPLRHSWALVTLIASLSMLGPFSIDLYLPAFPAIAADFAAPALAVQQTLSVYLFAYAGMMLWHGALADAFGRRPVIIASLSVYALATLGCAIAGNIESLWLFRLLQGLSAGAGVVVGRAVVRDRFHGADAQRLMAQVTLVFGIAPAIAPVIGGILLNTLGWRAIFWALLAWVVATLAWTARALDESLPREQRQPLHPKVMFRNYKAVLTRREFQLLAFIPALNFAAFFIYIAGATPFLVEHLGLTTLGFAALFVPMIAGVLIGATISGRVAGRWPAHKAIGVGYLFMGGASLANVAITAFLPPHVTWNIAPIMLFTMGFSLSMPSITLALLDLFPRTRGLASSLQGFVQFALSGFIAGSVAPALDGSLQHLAFGMAGFTAASYALWRIYRRRVRAAP